MLTSDAFQKRYFVLKQAFMLGLCVFLVCVRFKRRVRQVISLSLGLLLGRLSQVCLPVGLAAWLSAHSLCLLCASQVGGDKECHSRLESTFRKTHLTAGSSCSRRDLLSPPDEQWLTLWRDACFIVTGDIWLTLNIINSASSAENNNLSQRWNNFLLLSIFFCYVFVDSSFEI